MNMAPHVYRLTISSNESASVCEALALHTGLSKTRIKQAMVKGAVWIQHGQGKMQRIRRATTAVRPGDRITLYYNPALLERTAPAACCLEDRGNYSIWYKPAGLMSQGTKYGDHCSLSRQIETGFKTKRRVYPVHRLDREVRGVIIVAHTSDAAGRLSAILRRGRIEKYYQAQVRGDLSKHPSLGCIDMPLDGKPALSRYEVLRYDPETDQSTARVTIATGRLHQIRRHFDLIGHSVMGDPRYGRGNSCGNGLQLVAYAVELICPFNGEKVRIAIDPEGTPPC
jgi:tRNA pseudouridine32 synthase/23S rRNA pseudouridine746 synthase